MEKIVCSICGSSNLTKQEDVFICSDCLTSYSVDEARKLMIEGENIIDDTPELKNFMT